MDTPGTDTAVRWCAWLAGGLVVARWVADLGLERLNQAHVRAHAGAVPEAFRGRLDAATYARSVDYTLARSRFGLVESAWDTVLLVGVLFSGLLVQGWEGLTGWLGSGAWGGAVYLFAVGLAFSVLGLPFRWYEQFRLEQRFGFNTTTAAVWWADRFKGLGLAVALGLPLLALLLAIADRAGDRWWLWAWATVVAFQAIMAVLAPVVILPLFNKFTPLGEGPLRDRLFGLARRTGFRASSIQVMDGSKRSRHSNAFFTGFGRARRIVLFDTLLEQLTEPELEAVLAHEIGHYRRRHILKFLGLSTLLTLAGFGLLAWLARQAWFYEAFGFEAGEMAPAFLLFGLLAGAVTFWLSPVINRWSRGFEYEADAFAAEGVGGPGPLIAALRKLNEKNLANLTPHPLYSGFHYSHPTLVEREAALTSNRMEAHAP